MITVRIRVRFAWWWEAYVYGLAAVAALTGLEPDWQKVQQVAMRAVRVRAEKV